ncbi:MAG: tRNA (adenosine(37)-N6)-threonylcarbamoyltransferase complex dimerization subunit type 1 TsaB [Verrucomicrobiales bacterium]|nr:tRNA (adenosine(37)-N6)-threonylcarbamoyltransferase complex dimerization subunit type 1 TsaB [Verrucomicrobiales bacterium]
MILAIETSTSQATLVLLDPQSGELLWQSEFESDRLHNAKIFDPVAEALELCREKLQRIVVGLGPGSYSGIRVGIAVANGLGIALDVPVAGLASIAVLAEEEDYAVVGDARRSSYYLARIHQQRLLSEPELLSHDLWQQQMYTLRQQGLSIYSTEKSLTEHEEYDLVLRSPKALELARQCASMAEEEWKNLHTQALQPIYLRSPYITKAKNKPCI